MSGCEEQAKATEAGGLPRSKSVWDRYCEIWRVCFAFVVRNQFEMLKADSTPLERDQPSSAADSTPPSKSGLLLLFDAFSHSFFPPIFLVTRCSTAPPKSCRADPSCHSQSRRVACFPQLIVRMLPILNRSLPCKLYDKFCMKRGLLIDFL
jgi:hypothetical protein